MVAELLPVPASDRALEEVRSGRRGLSVEFTALDEHREGDLRVITAARLSGIGIVRSPSYSGATVENRRRSGRTLRARIPADETVACECAGQDTRWARVQIQPAMEADVDAGTSFEEGVSRGLRMR